MPVRDINNIYQNQENPEMLDKINFIFSVLNTKIEKSNKIDSDSTIELIKKFEMETEQNPDRVQSAWNDLVDVAQRYYETAVLDSVTEDNIKLLYSMNNNLSGEKNESILNVIANNSLDRIEQKEFISRYKDNKNLESMLNNSGVNKREAIDELLYLEFINQEVFEAQSEYFKDNICLDVIKANEDIANRYISVLGKDYSSMSIEQKNEILENIPPEELTIVAASVNKIWKENDLKQFMSEKFVQVDNQNNINNQGKNIINELKKANSSLDKIYIDVNGQHCTLEELSRNFNKFSDMYRFNQEIQFSQLSEMSKNLSYINKNTMNINANAKALVRNVLRTADPLLRDEIMSILPDEDKLDASEFLEKVDRLMKEEKNSQRKQQLFLVAAAVAAIVTAGTIAPALIGSSGVATAAATASAGNSTAAISPAVFNAIHSAGIVHATGSSLLAHKAEKVISFGFSRSIESLRDKLKHDSNPALWALAYKVSTGTTESDIANWVSAAGGWWGA